MRILFLQSLTYPFIGLMPLSAVLKKRGHEIRLQILNMARPSNGGCDIPTWINGSGEFARSEFLVFTTRCSYYPSIVTYAGRTS